MLKRAPQADSVVSSAHQPGAVSKRPSVAVHKGQLDDAEASDMAETTKGSEHQTAGSRLAARTQDPIRSRIDCHKGVRILYVRDDNARCSTSPWCSYVAVR